MFLKYMYIYFIENINSLHTNYRYVYLFNINNNFQSFQSETIIKQKSFYFSNVSL